MLASGSPRRAEILDRAGWPHEVIVAGIDESLMPTKIPRLMCNDSLVRKLRLLPSDWKKAWYLGRTLRSSLRIEILGQPRDEADAKRMLELLNGKWHEVLTGVALVESWGRIASRLRDDSRAFCGNERE